jgi:hypothetical protein
MTSTSRLKKRPIFPFSAAVAAMQKAALLYTSRIAADSVDQSWLSSCWMHLLCVSSIVVGRAASTYKESIQRNLQRILLVTTMASWNVLGSDATAMPFRSNSAVDLVSVAGWKAPQQCESATYRTPAVGKICSRRRTNGSALPPTSMSRVGRKSWSAL